jgi:hypothetical protein
MIKGIFVFFLLLLSVLAFPSPSVPCGTYSTAGATLTMNESLSSPGADCIIINNENITLDCASFTITGDGTSSTSGI